MNSEDLKCCANCAQYNISFYGEETCLLKINRIINSGGYCDSWENDNKNKLFRKSLIEN